jgi:hypothetical protein
VRVSQIRGRRFCRPSLRGQQKEIYTYSTYALFYL